MGFFDNAIPTEGLEDKAWWERAWDKIDPFVPNEAAKDFFTDTVPDAANWYIGQWQGELDAFRLNPPGDWTGKVLDATGISDTVKWAVILTAILALLYFFVLKGKAA